MIADLHVHSNNSDGLFSIDELIKMKDELKIDLIAITDHDSIECIKYENIIYGIELSTRKNNEDIHVLGYFKDLNHLKYLNKYLNNQKIKRIKRIQKICKALKKYYNLDIDYNNVLKNSKNIPGRPHVAKEISRLLNISNKEAFNRYLTSDSRAFIKSSSLSYEKGVKMLHKANALAIIAHPVLYKKNSLEDLIDIADGAECIYPNNTNNDEIKFINLVKSKNKIITAGSDFHGDDKHYDMGYRVLKDELLENFLKKLKS